VRVTGRGNYVERQALYYAQASQLFGLIIEHQNTYTATPLAAAIQASINLQERKKLLKKTLLSNPLFLKIAETFNTSQPSRDEISKFLKQNTRLAESTCERRASSVQIFLNQWLYGHAEGRSTLNSREWTTVRLIDHSPLPEWAQFILELGRISSLQSTPGVKKWRLVTVPHRNMVSALYALGYLEASLPKILAAIDEFDITDLKAGSAITWKTTKNELVFGYFHQVNPPHPSDGNTFSYSRLRSKGAQQPAKRDFARAREFRFAPYYGEPFVNPRQMSSNLAFFKQFAGEKYEDLLCNSFGVVCFAGRPQLRHDLTSPEFEIGETSGAIDDLLRVRGLSDFNEVAHYLTDYLSPDSDQAEVTSSMCAIFDGHLSYPKMRHYIEAEDNLVVLDRWERGSLDSFNAFDVDRATSGQRAIYAPDGMSVPAGIEYMEWSRTK
jgi:hypothetical protein